jgi:hypothetical protein
MYRIPLEPRKPRRFRGFSRHTFRAGSASKIAAFGFACMRVWAILGLERKWLPRREPSAVLVRPLVPAVHNCTGARLKHRYSYDRIQGNQGGHVPWGVTAHGSPAGPLPFDRLEASLAARFHRDAPQLLTLPICAEKQAFAAMEDRWRVTRMCSLLAGVPPGWPPRWPHGLGVCA